MKTAVYEQIVRKLFDNQYVSDDPKINGMFGKNRPAGDRKITSPEEKDEFKNQVFMTFNAVRTLDILKPDGYEIAISNALKWTENMLSNDAFYAKERYYHEQSYYDENSHGILNYRHTIGLASILLYTNHRLDIIERVITEILDAAQNQDGGWKLKADLPDSCIVSSIWAVIFLKLIINSPQLTNYHSKSIKLLDNTLSFYNKNFKEGYWLGKSQKKDLLIKINNSCLFLPEFSSEFYQIYPISHIQSLDYLSSFINQDGDFNNSFSNCFKDEILCSDDRFRFLLRITFAFYTSLFANRPDFQDFYQILRKKVLMINPANIQLKTLDICKYLFLLNDRASEQNANNTNNLKTRLLNNKDKIIKLKIPLLGFGSIDLTELLKTFKDGQ